MPSRATERKGAARAVVLAGSCLALACAGTSAHREIPISPEPPPADLDGTRIAALIGVSDTVARWRAVSGQQGPSSPEALALQHGLIGRLVTASFAADQVIAEVQSEESHLQDAMNELEGQSGDRVGRLNLFAGILGGLATLGTALTLKNSTNEGGIWVTVIAGGGAAVLTSLAAVSHPAGASGVPIPYSMLGPLLKDQPDPRYLPMVWSYLHAPAGAAGSPRARLLQEWRRLGWLESGDLSALTGPVGSRTDVSLDLLSQRLRMLGDLRSEVSRMKTEIARLADRVVPLEPGVPRAGSADGASAPP